MRTTIQVRARTELENVATEAMVRQCAKCKNRYRNNVDAVFDAISFILFCLSLLYLMP